MHIRWIKSTFQMPSSNSCIRSTTNMLNKLKPRHESQLEKVFFKEWLQLITRKWQNCNYLLRLTLAIDLSISLQQLCLSPWVWSHIYKHGHSWSCFSWDGHQHEQEYSIPSCLGTCLDCGHGTLEWCIWGTGIGPGCKLKLVIPWEWVRATVNMYVLKSLTFLDSQWNRWIF